MNRLAKYSLMGILICSVCFAIAGLYTWQRSYKLPEIRHEAVSKYTRPRFAYPWKTVTLSPGDTGDPFYDRETVTETATITETSDLILLGTLNGQNPRAIMAEKKNPTKAYIVSPGEVRGSEIVDIVGKGYVIIRKNGKRLTLKTGS